MNVSETTARVDEVNPYQKGNYKWKIVTVVISLLLAPVALISFIGGWLAYNIGRVQPSILGQLAAIFTAVGLFTSQLQRSIIEYPYNLMSLFDLRYGFDLMIIIGVIGAQLAFSIPLGLGISWIYALMKKSSMPEDELETYFRKTPLQIFKEKRNEKKLEKGEGGYPTAINMGIEKATGDIFPILYSDLAKHAFVVGSSGSGKTATLMTMIDKIIKDRHCLIAVDLKGDPLVAANIAKMCEKQGMNFHHLIAELPNTPYTGPSKNGRAFYNPMTRGDYDHLSDLIISMRPKMTGDGQAYKDPSHQYLKTLFHTLSILNIKPNDSLKMVADLLNPDTLRRLGNELPATEEGNSLRADIALSCQQKTADPRGLFASSLSGLVMSVLKLRKSIAGNYLKTPQEGQDYIDLYDIAQKGEVVLFSLDGSSNQETASYIAKYIIEDLKLLSSELNAHPASQPVHVVFDEFSAVSDDNLIGFVNKSRSAGISVILSTQTTEDLKEVSETFVKRIIANMDVVMAMNVNTYEEAEMLSRSFGEEEKKEKTTSYKTEKHLFSTAESSRSGRESATIKMGFKVSPSQLQGQGLGNAWVRIAHRDVSTSIRVIPPETIIMDDNHEERRRIAEERLLLQGNNEALETLSTLETAPQEQPNMDDEINELLKEKEETFPIDTPQGWFPDLSRTETIKPLKKRGLPLRTSPIVEEVAPESLEDDITDDILEWDVDPEW